jgi:hypothetical protein
MLVNMLVDVSVEIAITVHMFCAYYVTIILSFADNLCPDSAISLVN